MMVEESQEAMCFPRGGRRGFGVKFMHVVGQRLRLHNKSVGANHTASVMFEPKKAAVLEQTLGLGSADRDTT